MDFGVGGHERGTRGVCATVWFVELAEELEGFEGALVHAMEAGLVAVYEMKFGAAGEVGEGAGDAAHLGRFGAFLDAFGEEVGLDGPETAHSPVSRGHFFDHVHFHRDFRIEGFDVLLVKLGKSVFRLVLQHGASRRAGRVL